MKKNEKQRSIFPEKMPVFSEETNVNILNEVENLSSRVNSNDEHVLSRQGEFENNDIKKNDIAYLVKAGHDLPEADTPEKMLTSSNKKNEEKELKEKSSYRMVDLISNNYRLPEVEGEDFLK